jgi:hypothetical protein
VQVATAERDAIDQATLLHLAQGVRA